jgi:FkbM family methyltransferase
MKDNYLKELAKRVFFQDGSVRRIRIGPLRGMIYRVDDITGLSTWYSGAERDHQRMFQELISPNDVVIDVGANWGVHTLYFSKLVGPDGLVLAFEPFPQARQALEWHINANKCANVKIFREALSDQDGFAFFTSGESAYTGGLAEVVADTSNQRQRLEVKTGKLDSVIDGLGLNKIKLIKIDVEGAESKVLRGASRTIEQCRPYLIIDLHTPEQDVSVAHQLSSWGYRLSRLSGPPILQLDKSWPEPDGVWGTILASPKA